MLLKCLECNYKHGNVAVLKHHYESCHKNKTDKCMCGNIILSGICANNFSPWGCSLKNESSSSSSSSSSSGSGSGSSSIYDSNPNPNLNHKPNPNPNLNSYLNSNLNPYLKPNPNLNPNHNSNLNLSPNLNLKPNPDVLIRSCNKCNYIKPLTDFDESKYTCIICTSAKVNCSYCASVVRYDGIRAHVQKQHPDVDIPKGLSRKLSEKTINPGSTKLPLYTTLDGSTKDPIITLNGESWSSKYYNFLSFLINNGLNIEKVKENINLLKSIDRNSNNRLK